MVVLLAGDASVDCDRMAPARSSRDLSHLSRLIYLREGIGSVWGVEVESTMAFSLKNIVVGCRWIGFGLAKSWPETMQRVASTEIPERYAWGIVG